MSTAFARSRTPTAETDAGTKRRPLRIGPGALAFVAGFPGLIGGALLWSTSTRAVGDDDATGIGLAVTALAVALLVLGLGSRLWTTPEGVAVRFFGLRTTAVRYAELQSATFSMLFPSISFAITLTDRHGRHAAIHANWWKGEAVVVRRICQALIDHDVAMDGSTARVVAMVLQIKRPAPRIVHHALLRKDRTW